MAGKGADLAMILSAKDEGVSSTLGGVEKTLSGFGDKLKSAFSGLVALDMLDGLKSIGTSVVSGAVEAADSVGRLQAQLGLTKEQAVELGGVATAVFRSGFGESAGEVNAALATVRQNLGDMGPELTQVMTQNALTIKDLFGASEAESTRTVGVMLKNFDGLSETQAFDIITAGFQNGANFSDDMLDTMREYAPQFAKMGYSAEQMMAILIAGSKDGAFNLDKLGDGMKEFAIRSIDGSKTTAEGYKLLGLNADQMAAAIAGGGPAAQKATTQVLTALANMDDPVKQNAAGVALFGTTWEDLGPKALLAMNQAGAGLDGYEGATGRAANASAGLGVQWETLKRSVVGLLIDGITPLMPAVTSFVQGGIGQIQSFVPVIAALGTALATLFNGGDNWGEAGTLLAQFFPEDVAINILGIISQLGGAWRAFVQTLSGEEPPEMWSEMGQAAVAAAQLLRQAFAVIVDNWNTVIQVFQNDWSPDASINPITNAVGVLATVLRDVVIPAVLAVAGFIVEQFGFVVDWVVTNWPLIQQVVAQVLVGLQVMWQTHGANIMTIVQSAWSIIQNVITGALDIVLSVITAGMQLMTGDVGGAMTTLQGLFERTWARVVEIVSAAFTGLVSVIDIASGGMLTQVGAWMSGMWTAITTGLGEIVGAFTAWGGEVVAAISGIGGMALSAAMTLGSNIVSGIIQGIGNGIGAVREAAAGMVQGAIDAAFSAAESHSPSEVFKRLGVSMPDGLVLGVGSKRAEVEAAANAMLAPFLALGPGAVQWFNDYRDAAAGYAAVAGEIGRVEGEIAGIREQSQTDALFRASEMITIDSEALRLKESQVMLERDLIPLRQDLARATREVADIERGSLSERTGLIEQDGERKKIRLQQIDLEKQLLGLDSKSKKAKSIKEELDNLREKDRALALEGERIQLTNQIAATGARVRREQLDDQARGQEAVIGLIGDQIAVLNGEQAVFQANEAVIKNATDNEIAYRERLIAVFKAEGQPLLDRVTAGVKLIDQMEAEGIVGKELAEQLRAVAQQATAGSTATAGLGTAAKKAADGFESLGNTLGDLPSGIKGKLDPIFKPDKRALGGPVAAGSPYIVGENGPELFVPSMFGNIIPNRALSPSSVGGSGGGAFGGGTSITFAAGAIQVNGSVLTDRDLQEVVGQAVDDSLRYGGRLGSN